MALWRNIGGLAFIGPGATHFWEIVYPPDGRDVEVAVEVDVARLKDAKHAADFHATLRKRLKLKK